MTDDAGAPPPSLDPPDWDAFRRLAHAALDEAIEFVRTVRERPVWTPVTEAVRAELAAPPPRTPLGAEAAYDDLRRLVLPYTLGNIHPRFFGWVHGAGTPSGIVAEMLAAAIDANCGGRNHVGLDVERAVIGWCKALFGFPEDATGLILTGTSMANLTGLAVARHARGAGDVREEGVRAQPRELVGYTSAEAHESVVRAAEILGLGRRAMRRVPVDGGYRMDVGALAAAVRADRSAGRAPFCVVGTAGTVNTGAIDDLSALADLCRREDLWFHVDGAFGGLTVLSDALRPLVAGIERADSIAFDFHKWMHAPYDAGCLLVRDGEAHRGAFALRDAYIRRVPRALGGGGEWPCDLGPELSRGFRALKIWFGWKAAGTEAFARAIEVNCRQARDLAGRLAGLPDVEMLNDPTLSIVCFRFRPAGWPGAATDRLNEDVVADVQESGAAAPSTTRLRGVLAIRVNITNHRTQTQDLDILVRAVAEAARRRMAASPSGAGG